MQTEEDATNKISSNNNMVFSLQQKVFLNLILIYFLSIEKKLVIQILQMIRKSLIEFLV